MAAPDVLQAESPTQILPTDFWSLYGSQSTPANPTLQHASLAGELSRPGTGAAFSDATPPTYAGSPDGAAKAPDFDNLAEVGQLPSFGVHGLYPSDPRYARALATGYLHDPTVNNRAGADLDAGPLPNLYVQHHAHWANTASGSGDDFDAYLKAVRQGITDEYVPFGAQQTVRLPALANQAQRHIAPDDTRHQTPTPAAPKPAAAAPTRPRSSRVPMEELSSISLYEVRGPLKRLANDVGVVALALYFGLRGALPEGTHRLHSYDGNTSLELPARSARRDPSLLGGVILPLLSRIAWATITAQASRYGRAAQLSYSEQESRIRACVRRSLSLIREENAAKDAALVAPTEQNPAPNETSPQETGGALGTHHGNSLPSGRPDYESSVAAPHSPQIAADQQVAAEISAARRAEIPFTVNVVVGRGLRYGIMPEVLEAYKGGQMSQAQALVDRALLIIEANHGALKQVAGARGAVEDYSIGQRARLHAGIPARSYTEIWDPISAIPHDQEIPNDDPAQDDLLQRISRAQNDVTLEVLLTVAAHNVLTRWQGAETELPYAVENEVMAAIIEQVVKLADYRGQLEQRELDLEDDKIAPLLLPPLPYDDTAAPHPARRAVRPAMRRTGATRRDDRRPAEPKEYLPHAPRWEYDYYDLLHEPENILRPAQWMVVTGIFNAYSTGVSPTVPIPGDSSHDERLSHNRRFSELVIARLQAEQPAILEQARQLFEVRSKRLLEEARQKRLSPQEPRDEYLPVDTLKAKALQLESALAAAYWSYSDTPPEEIGEDVIRSAMMAIEKIVAEQGSVATDRAS